MANAITNNDAGTVRLKFQCCKLETSLGAMKSVYAFSACINFCFHGSFLFCFFTLLGHFGNLQKRKKENCSPTIVYSCDEIFPLILFSFLNCNATKL